MIKVRICSEHKYDIILGKGKNPWKVRTNWLVYPIYNVCVIMYFIFILFIRLLLAFFFAYLSELFKLGKTISIGVFLRMENIAIPLC